MADNSSGSSSGEEEHAILLGALAVLQQIDMQVGYNVILDWWIQKKPNSSGYNNAGIIQNM